jgi:hypothetical protein
MSKNVAIAPVQVELVHTNNISYRPSSIAKNYLVLTLGQPMFQDASLFFIDQSSFFVVSPHTQIMANCHRHTLSPRIFDAGKSTIESAH